MKTSRPFTMSYALIPTALLLTSVGILNFDSDKVLVFACLLPLLFFLLYLWCK